MALRASAAAFVSLLALAPLALAPVAYAADSLSGTRGEIVEKSHAIDLVMTRGHAHMRVVREVTNNGVRHDQAMFHLMLPEGAVATGLRTRGSINGRPIWYEGELLEAELAARRYQELTGIGGYYPKDPALLSWRSQNHLALQVFPCPPKEDKGVGYDLDLPTQWVDGRERLELSEMGLTPNHGVQSYGVATLRTDVPGARIFVEGIEVEPGTKIRVDHARTIEIEPPAAFGTIDARLGAVAFGPERNLVALRFDAPRRLAEVPRRVSVVVALDASRSLTVDQVTAQMRAASAYLSHFADRDATVALVAYDRRAHDLTSGFVGIEEARALLDGGPLSRRNGSALDEAVNRASALLATAPASSPKRVVIFGDLLARETLQPRKVTGPRGAVLHLASVARSDHAAVDRDDEDEWAALPRSTGGLLFRTAAPIAPLRRSSGRADVELAFTELARPIRIDRMTWRAAGVSKSDLDGPETLEEGASIEHRAISDKLPAYAILEGELWSKRFDKKVFASPAEGKLWSALVFGSDLMSELSEPEMNVLARAGRAVSPVTSYLAIEPGVRPSTEGLEIGEAGGMGFGAGRGRLASTSAQGRPTQTPDYAGILSSMMESAVARCGAEGRTKLDVETTIAEIVDVSVVVAADSPDKTQAACVREAVWGLELPQAFTETRLGLHVSL